MYPYIRMHFIHMCSVSAIYFPPKTLEVKTEKKSYLACVSIARIFGVKDPSVFCERASSKARLSLPYFFGRGLRGRTFLRWNK